MSSMMEMPWVLVLILLVAVLAVAVPVFALRWLASRQRGAGGPDDPQLR